MKNIVLDQDATVDRIAMILALGAIRAASSAAPDASDIDRPKPISLTSSPSTKSQEEPR